MENEELLKELNEYVEKSEFQLRRDSWLVYAGTLLIAWMGIWSVYQSYRGNLVIGFIFVVLGYINVITTYKMFTSNAAIKRCIRAAKQEIKKIEEGFLR